MNTVELLDRADRTLIKETLGTNIFVEAGAGSGKTRELVERILTMVDSGVELKTIAAITFTEKAAGELRERVRDRLSDGDIPAARQRALDQLDTAPIGTIHAFAARVISEHPIEAGVPPEITVVDELRSQIAFTRRWEKAREKLFADQSVETALKVLLSVGVTLDHLRNVAAELDNNWDRLETHPPGRRHIPDATVGPLLQQTADLLDQAKYCTDNSDPLLATLELLRIWHGNLAQVDTAELASVLSVLGTVPGGKVGNKGRAGNWPQGINTVRDACKQLAEDAEALRNSFVHPAVETVTAALAEVLLEAARDRQRSGELEYNDLLIHARDLLVGRYQFDVHEALHRRYQRIMLDEFQDTDPVQAEIAVRIAAADVCGRDGWEHLDIPPGRLFTVGDPKQSIYRFRRADIATYLDARTRFDTGARSAIAVLRTNFRSTGRLLDWINRSFDQLIQEQGLLQPAYHPLTADPMRPEWSDDHGPAVAVIGRDGAQPGESGKATAEDMRRQEARDVAAAVKVATGHTGSPAWLKQAGRSRDFENTPLTLKDICILLPTRTALAALEDALDDAGIEYRAEASSLVYSTQEVTELLLALRAIANTADEAALVLTLRSALFGCGDDELFEWKKAGGYWNLFSTPPAGLENSTVAGSLRYLAGLCQTIGLLSPAELMDHLVTDRRMLEAATDAPRYRDVWRRLRFVIDQARAWTEATHGGLRDYLVWAGAQQEENSRVRESVVPETDVEAVRIMTIHASKGLEFPMVILAGTGSGPNNQKAPAIWDQDSDVQVQFIKPIASAGYQAADDIAKQFNAAERKRLLYVACTRATSHLVVSLYSVVRTSLGQHLIDVDDPAIPALDLPTDLPNQRRERAVVEPVEPFDSWDVRRARWQATSAIASTTSVTAIAKGGESAGLGAESTVRFVTMDDDGGLPSFAEPGEDHGPGFGTALHRLMEVSGLRETGDFDLLAEDIAQAYGLRNAANLAERARSALTSEPVRRAAEREHWLELPVVTPSDDVTVEGIIDLMYREDDGSLVIADFKTDISVTAETLASYWRQLSTYAEMIQRIAGQPVSGLVLIFCRAGEAEVRRKATSSP